MTGGTGFFLCFMYLFSFLVVLFLSFFYYYLFFLNQCPSVSLSTMETRALYIRVLGRRVTSDCRITKGQESNVGHIPIDGPKLPMWVSLQFFCFLKIHRESMYRVGVNISSFVESHGRLGCELIITHKTPKNIQKYYIFNLLGVRQFCS